MQQIVGWHRPTEHHEVLLAFQADEDIAALAIPTAQSEQGLQI